MLFLCKTERKPCFFWVFGETFATGHSLGGEVVLTLV